MTLPNDWATYLSEEHNKAYFLELNNFLDTQRAQGKVIYPAEESYFSALELTSFEQLKVVIIGQDPYHGAGQAHGLAFSVQPGIKVPPSLLNIYKELQSDLQIPMANHGNLVSWASQGVLLLNSILTVEESKAGSHQNKGWEVYTDKIIEVINQHHSGVVFLLWGAYAQKKGQIIDRERHCVLETVHPSPLSARRGFLGCGHFSKANEYLQSQGKQAIDWSLPAYMAQADLFNQ
ncbi:uracil-DNA glycosylase [Marinomonas epiphytica]